jgi:hypothetical protein
MSTEDELAYISNYIVAILNSPTWVSPISKFVDENCGIFEDVEENKLEYTLVHNAFKTLIDDLLVAHLCEMSISTEQFMRFCERGLSGNNELHRNLVEQLISYDEFLVFKAMMVKRCADLTREVLGAPRSLPGAAANDQPAQDPSQPVVDESAEEAERLEAERRCVEAELQLAEALSMQLEKRLQLMQALDEVLELVSKIYALRADALEQQIAEEKAQEQDLLQASAPLVLPASQPMLAPVMPAPVAPAQLAPIISTSVSIRPLNPQPELQPMAAPSLGPNEILALERKSAQAAAQKERAERASAAKRQELTRVAATAPSFDDAPVYHPQHGLIVPPVNPLQPATPATTSAVGLQPSEEDKHARAEHLKKQRALLIERKNQERQSQLTAFQMQNGVTNSSNVAQQKLSGTPASEEAGRQLARELSGQAQAETVAPIAPHADAAALEMRRMLTRQLKASFT